MVQSAISAALDSWSRSRLGRDEDKSREQFSRQTLGHHSKVVHHAYPNHAEVTVPSLDDWEKQWKENPQKIAKPAVVQVDFKVPAPASAEMEEPAAVVCQVGG